MTHEAVMASPPIINLNLRRTLMNTCLIILLIIVVVFIIAYHLIKHEHVLHTIILNREAQIKQLQDSASTGMFKLRSMEPVDVSRYPKDSKGCINAFQADMWPMGQALAKDHMLMYDFHNTEPFRYCYIINTRTGERQQLIIN